MNVMRVPPLRAALDAVAGAHSSSGGRGHFDRNLNPSIVMAKSIEQIADSITNQKGHFPHTDSRPLKAQKHRYERRKVREFIKLGAWRGEEFQGQPAV